MCECERLCATCGRTTRYWRRNGVCVCVTCGREVEVRGKCEKRPMVRKESDG